MNGFFRMFLVIYGLIVGTLSAFSISYEKKFKEKDLNELEQALSMLGKGTLSAKKNALVKSSKLSFAFYLVYSIPALIYFISNLFGLLLTLILLIVEIIDYIYSKRKIVKAENFKNTIWPSNMTLAVSLIHIIIIGLQVGIVL